MKLLFLLLPAIFADSMALQQSSTVPIWGKGEPGTTITLTTSWDKQRLTATVQDDSIFNFSLSTPSYHDVPYGNITLRQGRQTTTIHDILFAEVWLAGGQSNMEMPMHGFWGQPVEGAFDAIMHSGEGFPIRFFKTPRQLAAKPQFIGMGEWYTASPSTTDKASAIAYLYAKELSKVLQTPVAIVESTWGGTRVQTWMTEESYLATKAPDEPSLEEQQGDLTFTTMDDLHASPIPTSMYNAMIHPIAGFAIKGLIMYHGETNIYFHPETYCTCFTALIAGWRKAWKQGNWPVYFVQIAPFGYEPWAKAALLRSEQEKASQVIPNSGMVVTMDIGDSTCIHPVKKLPVAQRLAGLALHNTYGYTDFAAECPRLQNAEVLGKEIKLTFTAGPQLVGIHGSKHDIEIADAQGNWHPAQMNYNIWEMKVWSNEVDEPHGVRYCWHNYAVGTLFAAATGLPVAPFSVTW